MEGPWRAFLSDGEVRGAHVRDTLNIGADYRLRDLDRNVRLSTTPSIVPAAYSR